MARHEQCTHGAAEERITAGDSGHMPDDAPALSRKAAGPRDVGEPRGTGSVVADGVG